MLVRRVGDGRSAVVRALGLPPRLLDASNGALPDPSLRFSGARLLMMQPKFSEEASAP